jgi:uncharacterized cupredoxin-like copper-binding protein
MIIRSRCPLVEPRRVAVAAAIMLLVWSAEAGAADWSHAQTVDVVTTEYAFAPSSLTFRTGVAYRLHIENHGKELHEFAAPEFFRAIRMRNVKALNSDHTEIDVQPGKQADFYFVAKTPGAFKLACPDHDWAGMTGDITIAP